MGSSITDRRVLRRTEILDAGEICLLARGYEGLKMDEVARRARVAKGTLYLYFAGRDALCAAVAERKMATLLDALRGTAGEAATGLEAVQSVTRVWLQHLDARPQVARVIVQWWQRKDVDTSSDAFRAYGERARAMLQLFVDLLERGQADGSVRPSADARYEALVVWSSVFGSLLLTVNPDTTRARLGDPFDPKSLRDTQLRSLFAALSAQRPFPIGEPDRTAETS